MAVFEETHTLLWFEKRSEKIRKTRKLESIHEWHLVQWKTEGRKQDKTRVYAQKPRLKMLFMNSISGVGLGERSLSFCGLPVEHPLTS